MSNIQVNIDTEQVSKQTDVAVLCKNAEITISNQGDYDSAATILKTVKSRFKEIDEQRKEITKPLDAAKKSVMELFNLPLKALEKAESFLKNGMINYTTEQEIKAREEQLRLQKLADQESAKQKKILDEKIARAEASGKTEKAEELQQQKENIIPIIAPVIAPQIETPKGVSFKENWSAVVTDANLVPREWCIPDIKALNDVAKATKGTKQITGVEFKMEKILSSRS